MRDAHQAYISNELHQPDIKDRMHIKVPVRKIRKTTPNIDMNHSHYIFVDDGKEGRFGGEIEFRANFERSLSQLHKCPTVVLVIQGSIVNVLSEDIAALGILCRWLC